MRRKFLSAGAAVGLVGLLGASTAVPAQAQDPVDEIDDYLNELINDAREDAGLDPLEPWEPLREAESGALDWSILTMNEWHIWHDSAHISVGTDNAGCVAGAENVAYFTGEPGTSAQEIAQQIFQGYQDSPSHWANIMAEEHEFFNNGTVTSTATGTIEETGQEITFQRWYNTQRFGQDCAQENIPGEETPAPDSDPSQGGGVMYSEYEAWEESGIIPPDDAVPPVDRTGEEPDEEVIPGDVNFASETLERGYLNPGDEFTVVFGDFEPGDVAYIDGAFVQDEGAGYANVLDPSSVTTSEVGDSGDVAMTVQLLPADHEVWDSVENPDATIQVPWHVRESLHDTDPRPGHEGDLFIDLGGLPDFEITVNPDELEPGDEYTINGSGFDEAIDIAGGLVMVRFDGEFAVLTDTENSQMAVDGISPEGTFTLEQVLLSEEDSIWDNFKDGQVHQAAVEVAVFESYADFDANNPLFIRHQNITIRLEDAIVVSPEAPNREDGTNTVEIPEVEGVNYSVDGDIVDGELEIPEDGLTVEATPVLGYEFEDGATTEWDFDFDPDAVLEVVEPEAPQRSDDDENVVIVPEVEGVEYSHGPGEVDVPEDGLTITAEPADGYEFDDGATTEWDFNYIEDDSTPSPSPSPTDTPTDGPTEPVEASVTVSPTEVAAGEDVVVEGSGFGEEEEVEISLNPILGTVETDEDGDFSTSVTIPEDTEPGEYTLTVEGLSSGIELEVTITVVDPETGPAGEKGPEDEEELATTGMDSGMAALGLAALLSLALGGTAIGVSRRRALA
ncbi:CAP domain-containing protein [Nesterenkonia alba]|uniref:CAP domain-containing protein n=1 Tax=Nesterenkonia alba TaxID=515814 RepID=UPI0003B7AB57|nr:CAP domain-containing protein [Nesterenkonia alba]